MTFQKGNQYWKRRKKIGRVKKLCLMCMREFEIYLYLSNQKFCSRECAANYNAPLTSARMKDLYAIGKKEKYWLGKKRDAETNKKISKKLMGKRLSEEHKQKVSKSLISAYDKKGRIKRECEVCSKQVTYGYKFCREHYMNDEIRKRISESHKGWKPTDAMIETARLRWTGASNPRWKGGITPETNKRVGRRIWRELRENVYKRDGHTCQKCGKTDCHLVAHHKIPYRISKDDSLNNLISLCSICHTKAEWEANSFELRNLS